MNWTHRALGGLLCLATFACRAGDAGPREVPPAAAPAATQRPRLVLWLTIDQLGANVLERQARHLPGTALGRLLEEGLWYSAASYTHSITETAPGHATLHTGAPPRIHGIIANEWFDRDANAITVSVFDAEAPLLGPGIGEPVAGSAAPPGRSPHLLAAPTVADALSAATQGTSRIVSISVKDRAAILSGGHAGKAYWLGPHGYVSSRYYHEHAPLWLEQHHAKHPLDSYFREPWALSLPLERYQAQPDTSPYAPASLGPAFPHGPQRPEDMRDALKFSPLGDRATLDLARSAFEALQLGLDDVPDLLALSLSACDYVGHYYGPETQEAEDAFLRLNLELEKFLGFVLTRVERQRLLVVLSADHGGTERAEHLALAGLPGRRLTIAELQRAAGAALSEAYGAGELPVFVVPPYVTLDRAALAKRGLAAEEAVARVATALDHVPGVHSAFIVAQLKDGDQLSRRVKDSVYPGRSGDIYLVPEPHTLLLQESDLGATHGSPWSYDSRVPIVLWGAGLPRAHVQRPVEVTSLAPTVARLLGIASPPGARGPLLDEALGAPAGHR